MNSKALYCGLLQTDEQELGDQIEPIYNSLLIQDVAWKTYWEQWTIGRSDEKESGKTVLVARYAAYDDIRIVALFLVGFTTWFYEISLVRVV